MGTHGVPWGNGGVGILVLEHLYLYPYVHYAYRDYYLPRSPSLSTGVPWGNGGVREVLVSTGYLM